MEEKEIVLRLSESEAWVLFEFVKRFSDTDELKIEDYSERRALWNLCCVFERTLSSANIDDFESFLESCKSKLRDF